MSEAALAENLVYYGHVGHGLLPGIRHVVRARRGLAARVARHYSTQVEKARTRRLMALFGTDWYDPGQYTVILNMAQISSLGAEKVIANSAKLADYQVTLESPSARRFGAGEPS